MKAIGAFIVIIFAGFLFGGHETSAAWEEEAVIIEVEGNPYEHQRYIETYHPFIEVVAVYSKLFNGLALRSRTDHLEKMVTAEFVRKIHNVQEYRALGTPGKMESAVLPNDLNQTGFTGKGVKVAVIDTGIDYSHPDLKNNYVQGYDLVDLDDDPMETLPEDGIPTSHGTHVAGIIAADGKIKGVAPDAEIFAYRALGPGGAGTSVQVLAALEKAVEDEVDVINLSLGNNVNIPDYPTSVAVNRAVEMGIPVVIANGNSGPGHWTVGSPATANKALSVGASSPPRSLPYLESVFDSKAFPFIEMAGSVPWEVVSTQELSDGSEGEQDFRGKIVLVSRGTVPFYQLAKSAEEKGAEAVIIHNSEEGHFKGSVENETAPVKIPVVSVSREDGLWLKERMLEKKVYIRTKAWMQEELIADFSSRGPVTVNWNIKPDILAPGTQVYSTIPGGYERMDGTSMAAPHVTGVVALIKEAHPDWNAEKIISAIKTTADLLSDKDEPLLPTFQGMGAVNAEKAIHSKTIIYHPQINLGQIKGYMETAEHELVLENTSDAEQSYSFESPRHQQGLTWKLPLEVKLKAGEKKSVPLQAMITSARLEEGVHQGWLKLRSEEEVYQLPYLFVNKHANQPKTAGFDFSLKQFSKGVYQYEIYLTMPAKSIEVDLYDPESLMHDRTLFKEENLETGLQQGEISKEKAGRPGHYYAIITIQTEDDGYETYETDIFIE